MMFVLELIFGLMVVGVICAVVAPVMWARQVKGSPHDRVQQAKTEEEIARHRANAAAHRLEADKLEAQRELMRLKTSEELERWYDARTQRELEKPRPITGEVVD